MAKSIHFYDTKGFHQGKQTNNIVSLFFHIFSKIYVFFFNMAEETF